MEWCQKSVWEPVLRAVLRGFTRPPWDPSACFWNERLDFVGWVYPPRVPGRCPLMIAQREFEAFPSQRASGIDCIHCVLIAAEAGSCSKVSCLLARTSSWMSLISPNWTKLNTQITEPWCSKGRNLKKKKSTRFPRTIGTTWYPTDVESELQVPSFMDMTHSGDNLSLLHRSLVSVRIHVGDDK